MKSSKTFNNISDELKAQIPKLKKGEVKTFLMLNGQPNPDPDPREVSKEPILYGKKQLMTRFRIFDPYIKDENGEKIGDYRDVGAVERWSGDNPDRFFMIVPGMDMGSRFQGKFSLSGGIVRDEELWEILWLSPEREGTPCKDDSVTPLFRVLDFKNETKHSNSRFDILKEAIDLANEITESKAREVMAALNQPTYQDKDTLIGKVKDLAREKPELFINSYKSNETPVKAMIRSAIDAGILDHDFTTGKISLGGLEITIIKTDTIESFVPTFSQWLLTADNGKSVMNNIKNQLSKKVETVKGK